MGKLKQRQERNKEHSMSEKAVKDKELAQEQKKAAVLNRQALKAAGKSKNHLQRLEDNFKELARKKANG